MLHRHSTGRVQHSAIWNRCESGSRFEPARLRRPRLAPRSAPRRRDKTTQYGPNGRAGERGAAPPPEQLRAPAANAPPAFPGEAAFRRIPAPPECAGHRALFDRGTISSKRGCYLYLAPPMVFIFDFRPEKAMCPIGPATGQGRRTVADTQCRRHPRASDPNHRQFSSGVKRPSTPLAQSDTTGPFCLAGA